MSIATLQISLPALSISTARFGPSAAAISGTPSPSTSPSATPDCPSVAAKLCHCTAPVWPLTLTTPDPLFGMNTMSTTSLLSMRPSPLSSESCPATGGP